MKRPRPSQAVRWADYAVIGYPLSAFRANDHLYASGTGRSPRSSGRTPCRRARFSDPGNPRCAEVSASPPHDAEILAGECIDLRHLNTRHSAVPVEPARADCGTTVFRCRTPCRRRGCGWGAGRGSCGLGRSAWWCGRWRAWPRSGRRGDRHRRQASWSRRRAFFPHSPCAVPVVSRLEGRCAACGAAPPASRVAAQSLLDGLRPPLTLETSAAPVGQCCGQAGACPLGAQRPSNRDTTTKLSRENVAQHVWVHPRDMHAGRRGQSAQSTVAGGRHVPASRPISIYQPGVRATRKATRAMRRR
jgi:hypothetical protein